MSVRAIDSGSCPNSSMTSATLAVSPYSVTRSRHVPWQKSWPGLKLDRADFRPVQDMSKHPDGTGSANHNEPGSGSVPAWLNISAAYAWRSLVLAGALVGFFWLMARLRLVLLPVIVALLIATMLVPQAEFLRRRRFPRLPAALLVMVAPAALLFGLSLIVAPSLVEEFGKLGPALTEGIDEVQKWVAGRFPSLEASTERLEDQVREKVSDNASTITSGILAGATVAAEAIAGLFLTVTLLFFFVKDGDKLSRAVAGSLPDGLAQKTRMAGPAVWRTLTGYVRGVGIIGAVNAAAIGLVLLLLDIPLVGPLMALTFVGAFFPLVGAVVAGLVAVLVALVSGGPTDALILGAVVLIVQQVEGDLISPLVFSKTVNLHPIAILVAITSGAVLAGVVGAFLAVPLTASISSAAGALRKRAPDLESAEVASQP